MAAFLVIGSNEKMNEIVDGINICRPHSHSVQTSISSGKVLRDNSDLYYEYNLYTKEGYSNSIGDKIPLENCINNQLAQLRSVVTATNECINVFLLANFVAESCCEDVKRVVEALKRIKDKNIRLITVLFVYDLKKVEDVNVRPTCELAKGFISYYSDLSLGFKTDLLYLNNQNYQSSAINANSESISRMLCDWFMLLSNANDRYNASMSIGTTNTIFSIGYSEFVYTYCHFKRYFEIALRKQVLGAMLNDSVVEMEFKKLLDYNSFPFGLRGRMDFLEPIFEKIDFDTNINDIREDNLDYRKHIIILNLKKYLVAIFDYKYDSNGQETSKNSEGNESDVLIDFESSEKTGNQINQNIDNCIQYIDRNEIYESFGGCFYLLTEKDLAEFKYKIELYNNLILYVKSDSFKEDFNKLDLSKIITQVATTDKKNPIVITKTGWWDKLLIWLKIKKTEVVEVSVDDNSTCEDPVAINHKEIVAKLIQELELIDKYEANYNDLIDHLENINKEYEKEKENEKHYTISLHSQAFSMINIVKMREFYNSKNVALLDAIKVAWDEYSVTQINMKGKSNAKHLNSIICDVVNDFTSNYQILNFDNYFNGIVDYPFIENIKDDYKMISYINAMINGSIPFVAYKPTCKEDPYVTVPRMIYTSSKNVVDKFNEKRLNVDSQEYITAINSQHIENKICIFQVLSPINTDYLCDLQKSAFE